MERTKIKDNDCLLLLLFLILVIGTPALAAMTNAALTLDPTFGREGGVTTAFYEGAFDYFDIPTATAIQKDGKIIIAGHTTSSPGCDAYYEGDFIARYEKDGALDQSFGNGGKLLFPSQSGTGGVTENTNQTGYVESLYPIHGKIHVQEDGKIVVTGGPFQAWRYNGDGSMDTTFGVGGEASADIDSGLYAESVDSVLQSDGKLLLAGHIQGTPHNLCAVMRFNTNGSLDRNFADDGKAIIDLPSEDIGSAIAFYMKIDVDQRERIVLMASFTENAYLYRLKPNGRPDRFFGRNGLVTTKFGDEKAFIDDMTLMPNGKIVLAGRNYTNKSVKSETGSEGTAAEDEKTNEIRRLLLARYNIKGTLDRTFGRKGYIVNELGSGNLSGISRIFYQDTGKVLVSAKLNTSEGNKFALARYTSSGLSDKSFGENGLLKTDYFDGKQHNSASIIRVSFSTNRCDILTERQGPDKVIIVGNINDNDSNDDIMLERYQF